MDRMVLVALAATTISFGGAAFAAEQVPAASERSGLQVLTERQMESVTAAGILLPNLKEVFKEFDNPAPGAEHPSLAKHGPLKSPWQAHFNSPVLDCVGC